MNLQELFVEGFGKQWLQVSLSANRSCIFHQVTFWDPERCTQTSSANACAEAYALPRQPSPVRKSGKSGPKKKVAAFDTW